MELLTIARLKQNSEVLGPGRRAVIWTFGCSRNCPQCIAREMNNADPQFSLSPDDLYRWILNINNIVGITITGGEPFEQDPKALLAFLKLVKRDPRNLSVMCYTGYLLKDLLNNERTSPLLEYIDLLVDGPYLHELNDGHQWRGSSNQKIHSLNRKYNELADTASNEFNRKIEIELSVDMRLELTGIPNAGFLENLEDSLRKKGYNVIR